MKINSIGQSESVVDLSAHEAANNPDGTTVDSNPFGLRVLDDRRLRRGRRCEHGPADQQDRRDRPLACFRRGSQPRRRSSVQAVPTSVAVAPNGDVYVGELTGAPFFVGAARVYRIPAGGGTPVVVATGFTNIIDIALGPDGAGYVLEHDANGIITPGDDGRLIRLNTNGTQTVLASTGLVKPGGVAIGPDGAVYVTLRANSAGNWRSGSHSAVGQTAQAAGVASDLLATLQRPRAA